MRRCRNCGGSDIPVATGWFCRSNGRVATGMSLHNDDGSGSPKNPGTCFAGHRVVSSWCPVHRQLLRRLGSLRRRKLIEASIDLQSSQVFVGKIQKSGPILLGEGMAMVRIMD